MIVLQGPEEKKAGIHYEVDESQSPIGVGGMGQVFKGIRVDERTGNKSESAVKFLFSDLPDNVVERARREASIRIQNQNLLEMQGFIQIETRNSDGTVSYRNHIVSELLYGVSLFDFLQRKFVGTLGRKIEFAEELHSKYESDRENTAAFIIKNLLSGVLALHDAGYVHRDIDPTNIMLTDTGKIKLIDFGIAKKIENLTGTDAGLTTAGQFMGKAAYAAPELVLGDVSHQNATTDIYAIGILLYQLVTGKLPFSGPTDEVLNHQRFDRLPLDNIKSAGLRKIIAKATRKKQSERYQSASEFRVDLDKFIKGTVKSSINPRPYAVAAAVIVVASVAFLTVRKVSEDKRTEELANQQAQQQLEDRLEELKARDLKDLMVDSSDPEYYENDEIADTFKIRSAGYYTMRAGDMISRGEIEKASELLDEVVGTGFKSSAGALFLQSRILFKKSYGMVDVTTRDSLRRQSLEKRRKAFQMDSSNCSLTYDIAMDYIEGYRRTGDREMNRDMPKAMRYLEQARRQAETAGDEEVKHKCDSVLSERFK